MTRNLDLALIGNGRLGLLLDARGEVVWGCYPRFDGDAMFCALLDTADEAEVRGIFSIDLVDCAHSEQSYLPNTAVLVTTLTDQTGGGWSSSPTACRGSASSAACSSR